MREAREERLERHDTAIDAVYQTHSEPGGSLPAWILNRVMGGRLIEVLNQLRRILAHDEWPTWRRGVAPMPDGLPGGD